MDPALWALLERYKTVINQELKNRGWRTVGLSRLMGAILADFLISHEPHITKRFSEIALHRIGGKLSKALPRSSLNALRATLPPELSPLPQVPKPRRAGRA